MSDASATPDDRDRYRIARARAVARLMRRLGWVSLAVGVVALVGIVVLLAAGEMSVDEALLAATGTSLVTMVSGAATYGSGMNLTLSASRLEREVDKAQREVH